MSQKRTDIEARQAEHDAIVEAISGRVRLRKEVARLTAQLADHQAVLSERDGEIDRLCDAREVLEAQLAERTRQRDAARGLVASFADGGEGRNRRIPMKKQKFDRQIAVRVEVDRNAETSYLVVAGDPSHLERFDAANGDKIAIYQLVSVKTFRVDNRLE